jgi:hypothetical protein
VHQFRVHDPLGPDPHAPAARGEGGQLQWDLSSCHLLGPDGRPARGAFKQVNGSIYARPANDTPIGLALVVDVGPRGRMMLQTCFLPARERPYELFLEIARWLIKQFVEDCETWQMWNPALAQDAIELWERARASFREALRCDDPVEAERLARRAVADGLDAGEALAVHHADHLVSRRARRKAVSATTLGVCIDPAVAPNAASVAALRRFDVACVRTPWRLIEPVEGKLDFAPIDAWVKSCLAERKPIVLGPFVDFGTTDGEPHALPQHVLAARSDAKRMRELVWAHVRALAARYARTTPLVIAASGANCAGWHDEGIDRMVDLTRTAVAAVRDVAREAKVIVELQSPAAESWRGTKGTAWPTSFLQRLVAENLNLAAAGVRIVQGASGDPVRDLMTTAGLLDGYVGRELPVFVTGFGVPSADDGSAMSFARGVWTPRRVGAAGAGAVAVAPADPPHDDAPPKWSLRTQAEWGGALFSIVLARTFLEGAWWSRLQDAPTGPRDGVLDAQGQPKPVFARLLALRERIERDARAHQASRLAR